MLRCFIESLVWRGGIFIQASTVNTVAAVIPIVRVMASSKGCYDLLISNKIGMYRLWSVIFLRASALQCGAVDLDRFGMQRQAGRATFGAHVIA